MRGWLLDPAMKLVDLDACSVAAVALATSYFEGIEAYFSGQDSKGHSKLFFRRGFLRVFPLSGQPERIRCSIANSLYELLRCGFAHDAMFRSGITFSASKPTHFLLTMPMRHGAFDSAGKMQSVVINPGHFLQGIERHFTSYVSAPRRGSDLTIKARFQSTIDVKWRLGEPGRVIAMSEEEFHGGDT